MRVGFAGSDSDFQFLDRKTVLRATMIVVGLLLLVLVFIACWHSILRWFRDSIFSVTEEHIRPPQELQRDEEQKLAGLKAVVVNMIPVMHYDKNASQSSDKWKSFCSECMICLSDFQDGEMIRVLPICGHLFHMQCVDVWFHLNTSCPVCRHNIGQGVAISASVCDEEIPEQVPEQVSASNRFLH
ncbi:hypothetical protein O6H91_17G006600 [Diphasiastrum complanatum]|uniref:Uncharacterized protein n=1 Tax=Diphasiastrum complanatum TaxID=34168 RepID=A0ACC2B3T3_DIPCM|nr:hypothetical protein O6H91_17G006600 [Diphasiastrum complanatum]